MTFIRKNLLFFLVIILSSLFRLTNLDLIEFKADEAINLFLASRPLFGHEMPPGGTVSSVGVTNFPLVNYLLFPITIISLDPKVISFVIAFLNVIAICGLFLTIRKYYNETLAFIAASLIAVSPWAILFSRKIWAQDLLLIILVPFIFSIHKITIDKNGKYWLLYSLSALFLIQIHQSALFFLAPLTIFILIRKPTINFKFLIGGIILGMIPTIPYFNYLIASNCFDCKMAFTYSGRINETSIALIFQRPFQILNQGNISPILGQDIVYFANKFPLAYYLKQVYYLEYALLLLGFFTFYKQFRNTAFLVSSVIVLPFVYALLKLEPHLHYYLIVLPFLVLFVGSAFYYLFTRDNKLIQLLSKAFFATIILFSIYYNFAFYKTVENQKNIKGDYGQIYSVTESNTKKDFKNYEGDPHYREMILASFIPYNLVHGNIGIAKMIYDPSETEKNMEKLEKRLTTVPIDRSVQNELVAYYTQERPTEEMLTELKNKTETIPGLLPVYEETLRFYNEFPK